MSSQLKAPLLRVSRLLVRYGGITAVDGISFEVGASEVVAMIGANGAGKSSTLMALSGVVPAEGRITFAGEDIEKLDVVARVRLGIVQVPEGRRVFGRNTVRENLLLGAYSRSSADKNDATLEEILSIFPILKERLSQPAGTLSGGEQQMLAIGRGLMAHPRLLLLDEPSLGLSPIFAQTIFSAVSRLAAQGRSILLVEQNARAALRISQRAYCLETGRIFLEGTSEQLAQDSRIRSAYLGV